jgi:hypothetical protein
MGQCRQKDAQIEDGSGGNGDGHESNKANGVSPLTDFKIKAKEMLLEVMVPTLSLGIKDLFEPIFGELLGPLTSFFLSLMDSIHDGVMEIATQRDRDFSFT